jgi:hypothetical protein
MTNVNHQRAATAGEQDHSDPWAYLGEPADAPQDCGRPDPFADMPGEIAEDLVEIFASMPGEVDEFPDETSYQPGKE